MSKHQYPSPFSCQSATPPQSASAECALIEAQDAIRCACDLLRQNATGKALEVLEAQLQK